MKEVETFIIESGAIPRPTLPPPFLKCGAGNESQHPATLDCPQQQQDGRALEWASEEMKGDRELCTAAVAQNGQAGECRDAS